MLAVKGTILTLRELDTRREFTANHDVVRLSSLTPNRLLAAAPPLPGANDRAPSPSPDAGQRAQSPTPSLTPPHLPSASQAIDDTPYSRLHLWLPLSTKPHQTRSSMPMLDFNVVEFLRRISTNYVVSPLQRAYNVQSAKLLDLLSSISDVLHSMRSNSPHLLDVHPSQQSNHVVSQQSNKNSNDDITIKFVYSSYDSIPGAVPSNSYCATSVFGNYLESPPSFCRRACAPGRTARCRRRAQGQHRTPQSSVLRTSDTPKVDTVRCRVCCSSHYVEAVDRTRDALRPSPYCSIKKIFERGASIGSAKIQYPY